MAKKKALTKAQDFYIRNNPEKMTAEGLALELDVSISAVKAVLQEVEEVNKRKPTHMSKLMGTHIRKGQPVATVMTKEASELGDKVKQAGKVSDMSMIHKPRG